MVSPKILCNKHLLGEHNELHKLVGYLKTKKSIKGWIESNCLELESIEKRHKNLASEMAKRGYSHKSPLKVSRKNLDCYKKYQYVKVRRKDSFNDLLKRCKKCRIKAEKLKKTPKHL